MVQEFRVRINPTRTGRDRTAPVSDFTSSLDPLPDPPTPDSRSDLHLRPRTGGAGGVEVESELLFVDSVYEFRSRGRVLLLLLGDRMILLVCRV